MARAMSLLAALLVSTALLAGCTAKDDADPPAAGDGGASAPPPSSGGGSSGGSTTPKAKPSVEPVADAGDVQGAFQKEWPMALPVVGPRQMVVDFALAGAQDGAPPTARVTLALYDPDGNLVKSETVGLGAKANSLSWLIPGTDVPAAGEYALRATADPGAGGALPSAGLAKYTLAWSASY